MLCYLGQNTVPQTPEARLRNNSCHTIVMTHLQAKYEVIHEPTCVIRGVKSIIGINNDGNCKLYCLNRSHPQIKAAAHVGVKK